MKFAKVLLIVLLVTITFGYHSLNANASDSGIYYDNIEYTDNVIFNGVDGVSIDYTANLVKPGDYYELYFDIVNPTNHNIAITDYICNSDDDYIDYELTYDNGKQIGIGDYIKKGESIRVKYKVLYKNYILEDTYVLDTSFSILYGQVI